MAHDPHLDLMEIQRAKCPELRESVRPPEYFDKINRPCPYVTIAGTIAPEDKENWGNWLEEGRRDRLPDRSVTVLLEHAYAPLCSELSNIAIEEALLEQSRSNYPVFVMPDDRNRLTPQDKKSHIDLEFHIGRNFGKLLLGGHFPFEKPSSDYSPNYYPKIMQETQWCQQYAWTYISRHFRENIMGNHLLMPVGEYGSDFAKDILRTTAVLLTACGQEDIQTMCTAIDHKNWDLIRNETARGITYEGPETGSVSNHILREGIVSLKDAVGLLTMERLTQLNAQDALEAVVKAGLPNDLARILPLGVLGPTILGQLYFPGLVESRLQDDDVFVGLSPKFKKLFAIEKADKIRKYLFSGVRRHRIGAGYGCPVSRKEDRVEKTGIQELSDVFVRVYNAIAQSTPRS